MLEHVARIVAAVGVPVTADLEAGYGDTPNDVGRTVARAVEIGAVGANLEDAEKNGLFGIDEAVDRIAAARAAAPSGTFVLNARTDTYFAGTRGTSSPRRSSARCATSKRGLTASSCQASSNWTRFAGSPPPSPAP
jgi:2-methylisocitrate lyase-like PEP mutase family enzyme